MKDTTLISEKTQIYCSEIQEVSAPPTGKGRLEGNEYDKVMGSGL